MTGSVEAEEKQVTGFLTGNELLTWCSEALTARCRAYDMGIADAISLSQAFGGSLVGFRACFPPGVNSKQVEDIATRFLREHPEVRHLGAASQVAKALADAFPCPQ
jgi:TctA family transporter